MSSDIFECSGFAECGRHPLHESIPMPSYHTFKKEKPLPGGLPHSRRFLLYPRKFGVRLRCRGDYPFRPEVLIPSTRYFWKNRKMMTAGRIDRVAIANIAP